ncbi:hypothetical protein KUTeg_007584 [Tegillarca granosa]|uniref:Thrombospondin-like N-terminal domain-containing protein n=1 Tax=Tegillarca granosa TaxID=220873 RepID=A0ABQ9FDQ1_TEGGR|nr:hypothetical protein KUTeg_007584 [Tegillarca granosa]
MLKVTNFMQLGENICGLCYKVEQRGIGRCRTTIFILSHFCDLENSDITFLANIKQNLGDSGSVLAFSSDIVRFLEIESSGRRDEIRFHYTHDQQTFIETFPYRLADNEWHRLAITLSGSHLTLLVDCSKIYERVIKTVDRTFTAGKLKLYVGQRNGQHALFRDRIYDLFSMS